MVLRTIPMSFSLQLEIRFPFIRKKTYQRKRESEKKKNKKVLYKIEK